jgi:uncharacterized damage-inducible protein DinB
MYHKYLSTVLIAVFTIISAQSLLAQEEKMMSKVNQDPVLAEFMGQINFAEGRLTEMAKAIPEDKYSWRPAEGIRSTGEIFRHVTLANYGFGKMAGLVSSDESEEKPDMKKLEQAITDKEGIIQDLGKSFESMKSTVGELSSEDLNKQIQVFGMEMTIRNFVVTMLNHMHEHLGQSIAYARMNGIAPPWSK